MSSARAVGSNHQHLCLLRVTRGPLCWGTELFGGVGRTTAELAKWVIGSLGRFVCSGCSLVPSFGFFHSGNHSLSSSCLVEAWEGEPYY